jgi:hypothetical protein
MTPSYGLPSNAATNQHVGRKEQSSARANLPTSSRSNASTFASCCWEKTTLLRTGQSANIQYLPCIAVLSISAPPPVGNLHVCDTVIVGGNQRFSVRANQPTSISSGTCTALRSGRSLHPPVGKPSARTETVIIVGGKQRFSVRANQPISVLQCRLPACKFATYAENNASQYR